MTSLFAKSGRAVNYTLTNERVFPAAAISPILLQLIKLGPMLYSRDYTIQFGTTLHGSPIVPGIRLNFHGGEFHLTILDYENRRAKVTVTIPVDLRKLHVAVPPVSPSRHFEELGIVVPEHSAADAVIATAVRVLSFVGHVPMRYSATVDDKLLPQTEAEAAILDKQFRTRRVHQQIKAVVRAPSFWFSNLDQGTVQKLLSREVGLALYADALRLQEPTAKFRELWRVLESAFGQKDRELVTSLAAFDPAKTLGFSEKELGELLVLRGRCSHAESSAEKALTGTRRAYRLKASVQ